MPMTVIYTSTKNIGDFKIQGRGRQRTSKKTIGLAYFFDSE